MSRNGYTADYFVRGNDLVSKINVSGENDTHYYYIQNGHGDVVRMMDTSGNMVNSYVYDPYGVVMSQTEGTYNPFKYCGELQNMPDNLIYLRNRIYDPKIGRFLTEDPIKDGTNWYVYCGNNPVNYWDPSGLIPTVKEAAYISEHVYHHVWDEDIRERRVYDRNGNYTNWRMIDMAVYSDLKIGVYVRGDGLDSKSTYAGKLEYVLAFEGTNFTSGEDWQNNVQQVFGEYSQHLSDGVSYTGWFLNEKSNYEITFTGHSKGGGEAAVNAMIYDKNAIVFNPSVPQLTYHFSESRKNRVSSYVVTGDMVNFLLGEIPGDNTTYLPQQHNGWLPGVSIADRKNNHGMEAVISALIERGYR